MSIISGVGSPGTVGSASGGKVTGLNNVGTVGASVIAANPARRKITFHNPGTNILYVYPLVNATGTANAPTLANPGGSFQVFSGGILIIDGECQGAWGAFGAAGTTNPITVMDTNV
jgi:hypothetical protein